MDEKSDSSGGAAGYEDSDSSGDLDSSGEGLVGALRQMAQDKSAWAGLSLPRLGALPRGAAASDPSDPDSESDGSSGPDLGEDILSTRLRAKKAQDRARESGRGRALAAASRYEKTRRRVQVDLNQEANLGDLEDAGLIEHMRRAREGRAAEEAARAALPSLAALREEDTAARRALSTLTALLKAQQMALLCACDEVHAHAANAAKLAAGAQPHGYPPAGGAPAAQYEHLRAKLSAAAGDLDGVVAALGGFERDLALVRRGYEAVADGLGARCAYFEGALGGASG